MFYSAIFEELDPREYFGVDSEAELSPEQIPLYEQLLAIHDGIPGDSPPGPGDGLKWACPVGETRALLARCASGDLTVFSVLARTYQKDHHPLTGLQSLCYLDFIDPLRVDFENDVETAASAFLGALNALQDAGHELDADRLHFDLMWIGQQGQLSDNEDVANRRMAFALKVMKSIQIPPTKTEIENASRVLLSRLEEQKVAFQSELGSFRQAGATSLSLEPILGALAGTSETVLSTEEAQRALHFFAEIAGKRRLRDPEELQVLGELVPGISKVLGDWESAESTIYSTLSEVLSGRLNGEWELNMLGRRILTIQILVLKLVAVHGNSAEDRRFAAAYLEEWEK
ncbi:MAG: hypothetical protein H6617_10275 [Bdellovibrionaceae bacterium]|nr:hypothetical protein [Pseudobdellovibrionaceae bacterium]